MRPPPSPPLRSCLCTQAQLESPAFRWWADQLREVHRPHRKLWEFCFIAQALFERGLLAPGMRGLGFAVGREPLPALFAGFGCDVVATDLHPDKSDPEWVQGNQHAAGLDALRRPAICPDAELDRRVTFRFADMTAIPADLTGFDFVWSSCAFEHLGSIHRGKRFIDRMVGCLKPGGVAVHTTEYNVGSNFWTVWRGGAVIYRRRDFTAMAARLTAAGHQMEPVEYDTGDGPADRHVDEPPYPQEVHLKLRLMGHVSTSAGLIIRAGSPARRGLLARWWRAA